MKEEPTDDLGRPLYDFHTLDQCDCGDTLIHEARFAYPSDPCCHVPGILVLTWYCPNCGLVENRYEDTFGHKYDFKGKHL